MPELDTYNVPLPVPAAVELHHERWQFMLHDLMAV